MDSGRECSTSGPGAGARLEAELEGSLREFVRLRTVSSDPTLREECFRGAKYLATLLESLGARLGQRLSALLSALWCYVLDRSGVCCRCGGGARVVTCYRCESSHEAFVTADALCVLVLRCRRASPDRVRHCC